VETLKDGKVQTEYYSKLVKADINGKDKVNLCNPLQRKFCASIHACDAGESMLAYTPV